MGRTAPSMGAHLARVAPTAGSNCRRPFQPHGSVPCAASAALFLFHGPRAATSHQSALLSCSATRRPQLDGPIYPEHSLLPVWLEVWRLMLGGAAAAPTAAAALGTAYLKEEGPMGDKHEQEATELVCRPLVPSHKPLHHGHLLRHAPPPSPLSPSAPTPLPSPRCRLRSAACASSATRGSCACRAPPSPPMASPARHGPRRPARCRRVTATRPRSPLCVQPTASPLRLTRTRAGVRSAPKDQTLCA